jgi:ATP-dependent Clp protease ATP-binding subunit ClpC
MAHWIVDSKSDGGSPSVEETIQILINIKSKYEDYHNVTYSEDAINACVKLSDRYMTDRLLPDKAIDVLDEVGARVHLKISMFKTILIWKSRSKTSSWKRTKW